eukprot:2572955-Pleurochrysis_carterae.AAC.1
MDMADGSEPRGHLKPQCARSRAARCDRAHTILPCARTRSIAAAPHSSHERTTRAARVARPRIRRRIVVERRAAHRIRM